ncbi:unnamed protein product [Arctia plantaginis]|uniref:CRAL-TRIO domain-containing protein n=1 Tax=Arctia plantaginis TaxID=874455 RepID=A0A8S0YSI7_ARCPL|nr:unnamed protein product [Arctia plantaginis]
MKIFLLKMGHYVLTHDYCQGFELVGDLRKLTLNNAKKLNPLVLHKALMLLTECMGQRMKKFHLFNGSVFFDFLLNLLKQGLSSKLRERIVIHSSIESLHGLIPKERLPKDFGGEEMSTKKLADLTFKELSSDEHLEKLKFMEQAATDESLRLISTFNEEYSGVPGSFKTLCVD